jgi:Protein of unknown function (DUF3761)
MRMRKVWTALALVLITGFGVHSAGAQADKKAATKSAKSDTTKKAAATVAPAGKSADAKAATTSEAPKKAGATKSASKAGATKGAGKAPPKSTAPGKAVGKTTATGKPADASGKCKDGSYTKAATKQGACSSHGGVAEWYKG